MIVNNSQNVDILQNFINKYPKYERIDDIIVKKDSLIKTQQENKFEKIDESAKNAYETLQKKKGNQKQYKKELDKFIKKWGASKNNKDSKYILGLINELNK